MLPQELADVSANIYINESEDGKESEEIGFNMDEINHLIRSNIIKSGSDDDEWKRISHLFQLQLFKKKMVCFSRSIFMFDICVA